MSIAAVDPTPTEQPPEKPAKLGKSPASGRLNGYSLLHKAGATAIAAASLCAIFVSYGVYNTYTNSLSCHFVLSCAPDKQFHIVKDGEELKEATTLYVKNS